MWNYFYTFVETIRVMGIKGINKLIKEEVGNFRLVKGSGYFYVASDDKGLGLQLAGLPTTSIYVCSLNHQSTQDWIDDVKNIISQF